METRYSRAQKDEALEAFRKQIENGSVMSGEIQELSRRLNIPATTLYGWKVDFKKKLVREGSLQVETSKFSSNDKFQAVLDTSSMSELELGVLHHKIYSSPRVVRSGNVNDPRFNVRSIYGPDSNDS